MSVRAKTGMQIEIKIKGASYGGRNEMYEGRVESLL
jgi:hypothetical protein